MTRQSQTWCACRKAGASYRRTCPTSRPPTDEPPMTSEKLVEACLERIAARDGELEAWVHVNAEGVAGAGTRTRPQPSSWAVARRSGGNQGHHRHGEMPTEYGSPIYRGHRTRADAARWRCCGARGASSSARRRPRNRQPASAGDAQSAQSRAHAGRLLERFGGGGGRSHGAARARHTDGRLDDPPRGIRGVSGSSRVSAQSTDRREAGFRRIGYVGNLCEHRGGRGARARPSIRPADRLTLSQKAAAPADRLCTQPRAGRMPTPPLTRRSSRRQAGWLRRAPT